jgi:phospholipase/carboxylesterase
VGLAAIAVVLLASCAARDEPSSPTPSQPSARPERPAAAPVAEPTLHLVRSSGSARGPIPYLTVEPADAGPDAPLILALHGRGSRAESFARFTEGLRLPARFIVARAPLPWGQTGGRQWFGSKASAPFEGVEARVTDLGTLIGQLAQRYPEAPKPIVMGFSQGAILAMELVAAMPERLRGVIALSGALPVAKTGKKAEEAVPMLLTTGEHDTIIPPEATEAAAELLRTLGHAPEVYRFDGGHGIPRDVVARVQSFVRGLGP